MFALAIVRLCGTRGANYVVPACGPAQLPGTQDVPILVFSNKAEYVADHPRATTTTATTIGTVEWLRFS
jgi:hypothetical protein